MICWKIDDYVLDVPIYLRTRDTTWEDEKLLEKMRSYWWGLLENGSSSTSRSENERNIVCETNRRRKLVG
jgi:hypothetical protein